MNARLLLLEDDPVSAAFLRTALLPLPAEVVHAGTLAAARQLADRGQALWLFDAHLPDGHASDLLRELRGRGLHVPALALTAGDQPDAHERLRQSGFARVLAKPLSSGELLRAVREWLPATSPAWDDAMALQRRLWQINEVFAKYSLASCVKGGLELMDFPVGNPLAPQRPLDEAGKAEVGRAIAAARGED